MIPTQKKDFAMNMTSNIYMNSTTNNVPLPITPTNKSSPQKLKEQSFVYRPPAPKNITNPTTQNKDLTQNKDTTQMKGPSTSNLRSSGIQVSKISGLGSSSLFKGLDGLYTKPVQYSDRRKTEKPQQKQANGNLGVKNQTGSVQTRFERNQINKLNDNSVSSTQYKATSPRNQSSNQQVKVQVQDSMNIRTLVRKPLGRAVKVEERAKQADKSPAITRRNQAQTKVSSAQQESFTTQTSSFVYKPTIRKTSVTNQISPINSAQTKSTLPISEKKEQVPKVQPKVSLPAQQNIYGRSRTRESKEVELNFQINTETSYFKLQAKGRGSRRSSKQISKTGYQSTEPKETAISQNTKTSAYPGQKINTQQKTNNLTKAESPKNVNSNRNIPNEVPYYMNSKPKVQLNKQKPQQPKNDVRQQPTNVKSPHKVTNTPQNQQSGESKGYVYRPKTYQNPQTTTNQVNPSQSKTQVESKSLNTQNQQKPIPYYNKKPKQQIRNETAKNIAETKPSPIKFNPLAQNKPIAQNSNTNQDLNVNNTTKTYYGRQNYQQTVNKVDQQKQEILQTPKPSFKYNSIQQQNTPITPEVQEPKTFENPKPIERNKSPQNQPQAPKYSYGRRPALDRRQISRLQIASNVQSPKNTQNTKEIEKFQQIKPITPTNNTNSTNSTKTNTSGYVYQPGSKKINLPEQKPTYEDTSNPITLTKQTVKRPAYLQNKKQPQTLLNQNVNKTIKIEQKQESKTQKRTIPSSAFRILSILMKKKIKSNSKFSFSQISQQSRRSINRDKLLNSLASKSLSFSLNYQTILKTQTFFLLKKLFVSALVSSTTNIAIGQGSRIIAAKTLTKTKQSKQDVQLSSLNTNMKKILCYKLHSLFNAKIRHVIKDKLIKPFDKIIYTAKKQPIFQALLKIFYIKTSSHLSNAFAKLKFSFSYVSKRNDYDVLSLFDIKNKKISKQQIAKYFQNIFQTVPASSTASRASLLEKNPEKAFMQKNDISKSQSIKSIDSPSQKAQSQKVITLRSRVQNLEKESNQQQKLTKEKESEIVSKKLELKRQMNSLKKQSQQQKKENEELKQNLKKYKVFNNFGDSKEVAILGSDIEEGQGRQGFGTGQNIATSYSSEFLDILCNFYVQNVLKTNSSKSNPSNIDTLLTIFSDSNPLIGESLNYLLNPQDQSGFPTLQSDQQLKSKITISRDLISERMLVEQNLLLKAQISSIEAQFTEENQSVLASDSPKVQEEVETMKSLVKNYIKERYLWEWIRNSISRL